MDPGDPDLEHCLTMQDPGVALQSRSDQRRVPGGVPPERRAPAPGGHTPRQRHTS
jgi:hypothetical protein